jgi:hypothetical protein
MKTKGERNIRTGEQIIDKTRVMKENKVFSNIKLQVMDIERERKKFKC